MQRLLLAFGAALLGWGCGGDPPATSSCSVDLALGKTTTSSGYSGANVPANAVDGDSKTSWVSDQSDGAQLTVDLGTAQTVGSVRVGWAWDKNFGTTATSVMQTSVDGATWTDRATTTRTAANNWTYDTLTFAATSARYVRFLAKSWNGGWGQVMDLQVFASTCP